MHLQSTIKDTLKTPLLPSDKWPIIVPGVLKICSELMTRVMMQHPSAENSVSNIDFASCWCCEATRWKQSHNFTSGLCPTTRYIPPPEGKWLTKMCAIFVSLCVLFLCLYYFSFVLNDCVELPKMPQVLEPKSELIQMSIRQGLHNNTHPTLHTQTHTHTHTYTHTTCCTKKTKCVCVCVWGWGGDAS